jgi:hypothetical protein
MGGFNVQRVVGRMLGSAQIPPGRKGDDVGDGIPQAPQNMMLRAGSP